MISEVISRPIDSVILWKPNTEINRDENDLLTGGFCPWHQISKMMHASAIKFRFNQLPSTWTVMYQSYLVEQFLLLEAVFQCALEVFHLSVLVTCYFFEPSAHQLLQDTNVFNPRCVTSPVQPFYNDHGYSPWNITVLWNFFIENFILPSDAQYGPQMVQMTFV